ncbi:MAG: DUF2284 domain-containing protein [Clostridiales bacterium]|nr:DUF2284 domain-containing protein [Clostridiales bacterium]
MADYEKLISLSKVYGFTEAAPLDVSTLEFLPEVLDMCVSCPGYGKFWPCPPGCGSLEEMRRRVEAYSRGLLVQTVGQLEDSYDWENMQKTAMLYGESFQKLWDTLRPDYAGLLAMGAGSCGICKECTYPEDKPCRFPERQIVSMSSCGLQVSRVCSDNHLKYYYGPNTISYTGCFLLE